MVQWQEIENELLRMRQAWSCGRDLRKLGEPDFKLRPILSDVVWRYTRGRCLDFAVRLVECNPLLKLTGFYAGNDLIHAFVMNEDESCIEVSGIWTLSEMKKLHANDGRFKLRQPRLDQVLADIKSDEEKGVDFDNLESILTVAGCLPHLQSLIPEEYLADDVSDALMRLKALKEDGYVVNRISASMKP